MKKKTYNNLVSQVYTTFYNGICDCLDITNHIHVHYHTPVFSEVILINRISYIHRMLGLWGTVASLFSQKQNKIKHPSPPKCVLV